MAQLAREWQEGGEEGKEVMVSVAGLLSSPGDLTAHKRLQLGAVRALVGANPNMVLRRVEKAWDHYRPPLNRHTRNVVVVSAVNAALDQWTQAHTADKPNVCEAVTVANRFMHYGGNDVAWANRVETKGSRVLPSTPFKAEEEAEHLALAKRHLPLNEVTSVDLLWEGYVPNLQSSRGLPKPTASKKDDWGPIMTAIMRAQTDRDVAVLTDSPHWKTAVIKLKAELHDVEKLDTKARAYYVLPAETSMALGCTLAHFYKGAPTFLEHPDSMSMVGMSLFYGGAERVFRWLDSLEATVGVFYADDGLTCLHLPSGRKWIFLPDISSMDMNVPDRHKQGWMDYLSERANPEDNAQAKWIQDLLEAYSRVLTDAHYLLPRGVEVKFLNFAATGFPANTHYETYVSMLMWKTVCEPYLCKKLAKLPKKATAQEEDKAIRVIVDKLIKKTGEYGPEWKGDYELYEYDGKNLHGILGHNLWREKPGKAFAAVPVERCLASLLNPRTKPKKSGSAVVLTYGRSVALLLTGGYATPWWWTVVRVLHARAKEVLATMHISHMAAMQTASADSEMLLGGDLAVFASFVRVSGGMTQLLGPPTSRACRRARSKHKKGRAIASAFSACVWENVVTTTAPATAPVSYTAGVSPDKPKVTVKVTRKKKGKRARKRAKQARKLAKAQRKVGKDKKATVATPSKPAEAGEANASTKRAKKAKKKEKRKPVPAGSTAVPAAPTESKEAPAEKQGASKPKKARLGKKLKRALGRS
jgi:hypothetical protein